MQISFFFLLLLSGFSFADSSIEKHEVGNWAGGFMVGRLEKLEQSGRVWQTWEGKLSIGNYGDDQYAGFSFPVAAASDEIAQQLQSISKDETYVFEFTRKHIFTPKIQDAHYVIIGVHKLYPGVLDEDPLEIEVKQGPRGKWNEGALQGHITGVERWGKINVVCTIYFSVGGLGKKKNAWAEGRARFNVYNENACQFAEKVLISGRESEVSFSEYFLPDYIDATKRIAHKIRILSDFESSMLESTSTSANDSTQR
ncbi:MAG: hypothetical protein AB7F43_10410 [Bacteriovoracia bacterium]